MTSDRTLVIVGASLAGAKAAEAARAARFDGRVVLIGEEREAPYERPPLSKAVLRGDAAPETARVHDDGFYAAHGIEVLTGRTALSLDAAARHVRLDDGEPVPFTTAVLTTGAAVRRLGIPGASLHGVHYLRTLDDARRLGDAIRAARRVAVIGAGWIGSEVAASARQMGAEVALVDPAPVPLQRVLGDQIGEVFRNLHADHGVHLRLGVGVSELRGASSVEQVARAIIGSALYDEQLSTLVGAGRSVEDAYWELVTSDITAALGLLRTVVDDSGAGDGFVSVEVAPAIAGNTAATVAATRQLQERIDAANLMVKIPATVEGVLAIEAMIAESYPDTLYVDSLIGPDTVTTLPEVTIAAFEDHGSISRTLDAHVEEAAEVMRRLAGAGIDMDDVASTLGRQGLAGFQRSFEDVLAALDAKARS